MSLLVGGLTSIVMGTKERIFSPLPHDVSLENLVPKDNFYRRLEELEELEEALVERCVALCHHPELIRSYTHFHWWPQAA